MRALFGVVSMLLALAVVGLLAVRQLGAGSAAVKGPAAEAASAGVSSTAIADPSAPVPAQSPLRELPERVRGDVDRALRDAAAARTGAEP